MSEGVFTIAAKRPIREEMTISRNTGLGTSNSATWFSLGAGTSITPESYDTMSIYIGAAGTGTFLIGEQPETMDLHPDEILSLLPQLHAGHIPKKEHRAATQACQVPPSRDSPKKVTRENHPNSMPP